MKHNSSRLVHITYLILAHKLPTQVADLVRALDRPDTSFVIHVDLGKSLDGFLHHFEGKDNVFLLTERKFTKWGSFGLIDACLTGIKFIKKHIDTDRAVLLSGQDYPLKSHEYITAYFANNTEAIFIDYFKLPSLKRPNGGLGRFPSISRPTSARILYSGSQWVLCLAALSVTV